MSRNDLTRVSLYIRPENQPDNVSVTRHTKEFADWLRALCKAGPEFDYDDFRHEISSYLTARKLLPSNEIVTRAEIGQAITQVKAGWGPRYLLAFLDWAWDKRREKLAEFLTEIGFPQIDHLLSSGLVKVSPAAGERPVEDRSSLSSPRGGQAESPIRRSSLVCTICLKASADDRLCLTCRQHLIQSKPDHLEYLIRNLENEQASLSQNDRFLYRLPVQIDERVSASRTDADSISAFSIGSDLETPHVFAWTPDVVPTPEITEWQVDLTIADALYNHLTSADGDTNLLDRLGKNQVAYYFYEVVKRSKYGFSIPQPRIEMLLNAALTQLVPACQIVLLNLASKAAHLAGLHVAVREAQKYLLEITDTNIFGAGSLHGREALFLSTMLPNIYTSLKETDLAIGQNSEGLRNLEKVLNRVFGYYDRPLVENSNLKDLKPLAGDQSTQWDLILKCETYRLLYCMKSGLGLDWLGGKESYVPYVHNLVDMRSYTNPKETLHLLTPLAIAFLDAGYADASAAISDLANDAFDGKTDSALSAYAADQKRSQSAEYAIHHMCRAQILHHLSDRGYAIGDSLTISCREIEGVPSEHLQIPTFRSVKPELANVRAGKNSESVETWENSILSKIRGRDTHFTFFCLPAYGRLTGTA